MFKDSTFIVAKLHILLLIVYIYCLFNICFILTYVPGFFQICIAQYICMITMFFFIFYWIWSLATPDKLVSSCLIVVQCSVFLVKTLLFSVFVSHLSLFHSWFFKFCSNIINKFAQRPLFSNLYWSELVSTLSNDLFVVHLFTFLFLCL